MPTITDLEPELYLTEGDAPVQIDGDVTVSDAEDDYDGGSLVVSGLAGGGVVTIVSGGSLAFDSTTGQLTYGGVLIGTVSGGSGVDLVVQFTADTTSAHVELLIESLFYQNVSHDPAFENALSFTLTDGAGNTSVDGTAYSAAGPDDPFTGLDIHGFSRAAFADLDGDGDQDVIIGDDAGLRYLRNIGTATTPVFTEVSGADNPLAGMAAGGSIFAPTLGDLDGDGDQDLFVGYEDGSIRYFENIGATAAPLFVQADAKNPFSGYDAGFEARPALVDFNGDGLIDMVVGAGSGDFHVFRNDGTASTPVFTNITGGGNDPFQMLSVAGRAGPYFADLDGDGDLDMVSGMAEGPVVVFENVGSATQPVFAGGNPTWFGSVSGFGYMASLVDLNGDGRMDLVLTGDTRAPRYFIAGDRQPGVEIFIDGVDDPAVARDDAFQVAENGVLNGDLFADNGSGVDTDPDSPLQVVAINGEQAAVGETITLPSGALLTVNADGTFSYDPNHAFDRLGASGSGAANTTGRDSFVYDLGNGVTATVTIVVKGVDSSDVLQGTAGNDTIDGGAFADVIHGGLGADFLLGGGGGDRLYGEDGDDILWGQDGADKLYGGDGADQLLGGDGNDILFGDAGQDRLNGGAGNDVLDGGADGDQMIGGAGNDIYYVDHIGDVVIEAAGEGTDTVRATLSWTLAANFENLELLGSADLDGVGNGLANVITGNDGANLLRGLDGADKLYGGGGDDRLEGGSSGDFLYGGDGDDVMIGGSGNDYMTGGAGADHFLITQDSIQLSRQGLPIETDIIYDLTFSQGDVLDLSAIDANLSLAGDQAFQFVGAFTKQAGQATLIYNAAAGITQLRLDVDGDGKADYQANITSQIGAQVFDPSHAGEGGWIL